MKKLVFTLSLLCIALFGNSQKLIVQNVSTIDEKRYENVKGSPYLFKGWATATLVGTKGNKTENIKINYNGFAKEWEVLVDDKHITLETTDYKELLITPPESKEELLFKRGLHKDYATKFPQVIYKGEQIVLIKNFIITKSLNKIQNVGKTIEVERFGSRNDYWMIKDNKVVAFKMKKKEVLKQLGDKSAIAGFYKKEKINLTKTEDVEKLLAYYESL